MKLVATVLAGTLLQMCSGRMNSEPAPRSMSAFGCEQSKLTVWSSTAVTCLTPSVSVVKAESWLSMT